MRMSAIVPTMEREYLEDLVLPRGVVLDGTKHVLIPKGQRILISLYAMQQHRDIWGDDPEVFRSERWENH